MPTFVIANFLFTLRLPRYLNEVTCGIEGAVDELGDQTCLLGSGGCVSDNNPQLFLVDVNGAGIMRKDEWVPYQQSIRSGCNCQLTSGSSLEDYAR